MMVPSRHPHIPTKDLVIVTKTRLFIAAIIILISILLNIGFIAYIFMSNFHPC